MNNNTNPDGEYLEPMIHGKQYVGFVDEIHGEGSQTVPGFDATKAELLLLVGHYAREALGIAIDCFLTGSSGSYLMRMEPYARRRIERIGGFVGDEAVEAIWERIEDQVKNEVGDRAWRIFVDGDIEARDRRMEAILASLEEENR